MKHYWILNKKNNTRDNRMGLILAPAHIGEKIEKLNLNTLRKLLNEANCFDVDLLHQENDILELHFTCNTNETNYGISYPGYLVYAFVYKKGKWRKTTYDPFGNNLSLIQAGKILKPFTKQLNPQ